MYEEEILHWLLLIHVGDARGIFYRVTVDWDNVVTLYEVGQIQRVMRLRATDEQCNRLVAGGAADRRGPKVKIVTRPMVNVDASGRR